MAFAMFAPMFCVPPMEHILKEELLLTHTETSLLFTAPTIMIVALAIPAGMIADRIGIRKAAGIGAIIMVVGTVLRATATSSTSILAFTFIYGVGFPWALPNLPELVSAWVPQGKAGTTMGIFTTGILTGVALALAITMPAVFPLTNTFQGVFLIWSIPTIVAAILWWRLVRNPPNSNTFDEPVKTGEFRFHVLGNKNLWLLSIVFLLATLFFYAWSGWAPALMMSKGATPQLAGIITSITTWVGIPTVFFMPQLASRLGLRKPFLWLPSIILAFAAWGAINVNLAMSWPIMALVGVAANTMLPIILALPVEMIPKEEVGIASGLVLSIGYIGGIIGPLIGGLILDLTSSLDLSFTVLAGVSAAAAGLAFRLPETGPRARKTLY
jgi:CP family cyanate transporter-like MFS transporter